MARIYSRGKTLWIRYSVNGKEYRESLVLKDNRENRQIANRIKKQKEVDLLNGLMPQVKKFRKKTLQSTFNEFLKTKEGKSKRTIEAYEYSYSRLKEYLGEKYLINRITDDTVKSFNKWLTTSKRKYIKNEKGERVLVYEKDSELSKNSIEFIFRHIRIFFEYCKNCKYIEVNPFPRKESTPKKINIISIEEQNKILDQLRKENYNQYKAIKLMLMTGFIRGEILRLSFEDIDFKKNLIYVKNSKGKRTDEFPLYLELREFFYENWDSEERKGKVINYKCQGSLRYFENFLSRHGYPHYTLHELRKTFLTRLANAGMSLFDLQVIARHRDVRTTQKYYLKAEIDRIGGEISGVINRTINRTTAEKGTKTA